MNAKPRLERNLERGLFAARWLLAPFYVGLAVALIMLLVVFVRELAHYARGVLVMHDEDAILAALSLVDLTLAANLVLIVLFAGYEHYVAKLDPPEAGNLPDWVGVLDFSKLKLKLVGSIVAISGLHLLGWFLEIGSGAPVDPVQLRWLVAIHLTLGAAGVLLALMDWLASRAKPD